MIMQVHESVSTLQPSPVPFLVLVFSPTWDEAEPVVRTIRASGFDVIVAHTVEDGIDLMIAEQFDAVVATDRDSMLWPALFSEARETAPQVHRLLVAPEEVEAANRLVAEGLVETIIRSTRAEAVIPALHRTFVTQPRSRRKFVFH